MAFCEALRVYRVGCEADGRDSRLLHSNLNANNWRLLVQEIAGNSTAKIR